MSWVGKYFTRTSTSSRTDATAVRGLHGARGPAAEEVSFWNWAGIPMFRASFAGKLRKRLSKHARTPRTSGLRLRYVSSACGHGSLTVGVYRPGAPVRDFLSVPYLLHMNLNIAPQHLPVVGRNATLTY